MPEDRTPFEGEPLDNYPPEVRRLAKLLGSLTLHLSSLRATRQAAADFNVSAIVDHILEYPVDRREDELQRLVHALTQDAVDLLGKDRRAQKH